jgi:hypothetical protein
MATETKEVSITYTEDQSNQSDTFPRFVRRKEDREYPNRSKAWSYTHEHPNHNITNHFDFSRDYFYSCTFERMEKYYDRLFFPVHIGDTYQERYRIMLKIGHGASSIVWLAVDLTDS